jgi:hypothetical protein
MSAGASALLDAVLYDDAPAKADVLLDRYPLGIQAATVEAHVSDASLEQWPTPRRDHEA